MTFFAGSAAAAATGRFPRPEFESGHEIPPTIVPPPPGAAMHLLDVSLLILALSAASYFALKTRSRKGVAATMLLSLLYFGFYRGGCVCSVGSIQNVALALFNGAYPVSWVVFVFFATPLVFALFFGRVFCGAVCPLGAIQDVFILKPVKVPKWLEHILGMFPYLYLGVAVLFAATGTGFIICQADLFVGFFRFSGPLPKIIAGAAVLVLGAFVARPYCRFVCPYSVLLRWASFLSWRRLKISPSDCVKCSLCVDACPFGAVEEPAPAKFAESRAKGVRRLAVLMLCVPLMALAGGFAGYLAGPMLAKVNPVVRRAHVEIEPNGETADETITDSTDQALRNRAARIEANIVFGAIILGVFIGLVLAFKLISLSTRPTSDKFTPDRAKCLECARCIPSCPVEKQSSN
ncbi:MAG: 4Fe-4S binding protein [Victivallales bacterium]|nr:4Fe-4S binding protein [Victivallales bacterium]